ncbi:patatin-like phospholipase family protein [Chthonobacter rhizosphaerae]|uniref:patatin-like phospholipase family protein n=1 Tax=Chthonobacter rhizosphaerae TaxID=2735553 RepID=UPI0015EE655C|nr:patatin-like phospholipase family protein [Chthonobacter rhizosphaerae]
MPDSPATPRIGLALGGGGARGLAHVHVLEALDEMGLRPSAITGTSIGAIVGAGYAAGMTGAEVREVVQATFAKQADVWGKVWQLRPKTFADLFGGGLVQFDAEKTIELFLPAAVPDRFDALTTRFCVMAADFYGCQEVALASGPLRPAIAASIAIPILFRPVEIDGRVLIDGGVVNPLPFDRLPEDVDVVIAVDVVGMPVRPANRPIPNATESIFGASQILMQTVTAEKLKSRTPDILIKPAVDLFRVMDFLKAMAILKSTQAVKDEVKRKVAALLEGRAAAGVIDAAGRSP